MNSDYIYYRLSGRLAVDPSKATTFFLREQSTGRWNAALLNFLGIDENQLPEILPSGTAAGTLRPELCKITGLPADTALVTGAFDHPTAARSTGVFDEGELLISAGTSWVVFAPVRDRQSGIDNRMLIDPFLSPEGCWGAMFSLTSVSEKIDVLLKRRFGDEVNGYRYFDETALNEPLGAHGLMINPWEAAVDDIIENSGDASDGSFSRAVMEGCAFLMRKRIEVLKNMIHSDIRRIVMVGGPTKSPVWPDILSAVIGVPISIPDSGTHAGARGAAVLAGIGAGVFTDPRDGWKRVRSAERLIAPEHDDAALYDKLYLDFFREYG